MEQSTSSHQQSQKLSCSSKTIEDVEGHYTKSIPKDVFFEYVVQEDEREAVEVC